MDEHDQGEGAGIGEFCELQIATHPHLDPSAPPPWHEFPWGELFQRLDGDPPDAPGQYEAVADALREVLAMLVAPTVGKLDPYRIGLRVVGLALALNRRDLVSPKMRQIYIRRLCTARWRERRKRKA